MGVGVFVWIVFLINGPVNSMFWSHRSDVFAMVFLWRVRFWLRMNAGGVLNTCKSNGIPGACAGVRVANG